MVPLYYFFVEEKIKKAVENGDFDNLPGMGKPHTFNDELPGMPQEIKLAYKILKDNGYFTEEINDKSSITFDQLMKTATDGEIDFHLEKYRNYEKLVQKKKLHKNPFFRKYARKIQNKLFPPSQ